MTRQTIAKRLRRIISRWLGTEASVLTFDCPIFKDACESDLHEITVDIYSQFEVCMTVYDFEDLPTFKDLVDYIANEMQEP